VYGLRARPPPQGVGALLSDLRPALGRLVLRAGSSGRPPAADPLVTRARPDFEADLTTGERVFVADRSRHGLSPAELAALLASQDGLCAICRSPNPGAPSWPVDHDHRHHPGTYGCRLCVRGMLCTSCNWLLANAKDNPVVLRAAAEYLERAAARRRW